ncbi:hypothetical protein EUTSA_v10015825mg [Eutrema salsugineum]|uniref:Uncharacterized protein n=1 Tax=Eutrema salsugineum TaxID=72664 RepID=V4NB96_EUTSA|nr:O-acyltransferase WSD1 [Eutrema salsugineum]ESQ43166.1 hypothetical protein EUTSA_v10015825mg [Eutrema salsugineum]
MTNVEEEEPLSPVAQVYQSPGIDYCVVTIIGFKTKINAHVIIDDLRHNVYKHPRFSCKLGSDGTKWIKTKVNIEDHVVIPTVDLEEIGEDGDGFVDDYVSRLTMIPLDKSRPLWDIHILNVKTSDAEAVSVIRSHHSLGDATSLMSLLVACTRKTSDPETFPTIPALKRRETRSFGLNDKDWFTKFIFAMCNALRLIWNTSIDLLLLLATLLFLKDTETPLRSHTGTDSRRSMKRFYHRAVSLDDIRHIKKAMNMTINDVLLGIIQAALSRYMNGRYDKRNVEGGTSKSDTSNLPQRIRFRAVLAVNLRSEIGLQPLAGMIHKGSKCRWGNCISLAVVPFFIGLETDPLVYLTKTKSTMDRKKNSLQATIMYWFLKLSLSMLGAKVGGFLLKLLFSNTTICVSNVVGPVEEVSYQGQPIAYISLSGYGHSQALLIHFLSYAEKMVISIAVDPSVIPDPHKLFDEMEESLKAIKNSLLERDLF